MALTNHVAHSDPGTPSEGRLSVTVTHDETGTEVKVVGQLDECAARVFRRRLLELLALPVETVTVDLSASVVSAGALDAVAEALEAANDRRIPLQLVGFSGA